MQSRALLPVKQWAICRSAMLSSLPDSQLCELSSMAMILKLRSFLDFCHGMKMLTVLHLVTIAHWTLTHGQHHPAAVSPSSPTRQMPVDGK